MSRKKGRTYTAEQKTKIIKQLTEAALATEIDSHLTQDLNRNFKISYFYTLRELLIQ